MFKIAISIFLLALPLLAAGEGDTCKHEILKFQVVDPSVSPPIYTDLTGEIDLLDYPDGLLNIKAVLSSKSGCDPSLVKCVKFDLDGKLVRKERFNPYFLYGNDVNGPIHTRTPKVGPQLLRACAYSDESCTMDEMGCYEMNFDVIAAVTETPTVSPTTAEQQGCHNEVTGFELVDTENPYNAIATSFNPPLIDLKDYSTCSLNIFANVAQNTCGKPPVKCVKMWLGSAIREETTAPYALYGNSGNFIRSGTPSLGSQSLKACTYTDSHCSEGEAGCMEVNVFVNDCMDMSM